MGEQDQSGELRMEAFDLIDQWPRIPWWRLLARRRCTHEDRLCIHGDGIRLMGYARAVCMDCGRRFVHLSEPCRFTGKPHFGSTSHQEQEG